MDNEHAVKKVSFDYRDWFWTRLQRMSRNDSDDEVGLTISLYTLIPTPPGLLKACFTVRIDA